MNGRSGGWVEEVFNGVVVRGDEAERSAISPFVVTVVCNIVAYG